ncbi:MAG: hypothetical protein Q9M36_03025 [Sulfurovum sp.]|nr:hypothetical protein [Sulfurovum sp.]
MLAFFPTIITAVTSMFSASGAYIVLATIFLYSKVKMIFKILVFTAFLGVITFASLTFLDIFTDLYTIIKTSLSGFGQNYTGLLGCIVSLIGLDKFLTSIFAVISSGLAIWGLAVGYIITYKLSSKALMAGLKALT